MFTVRKFEILNDASRVHAVTAGTEPSFPAADKGIIIDRSNKFSESTVTSIWKRVATDPVAEVASFKLPTTLAAGLYRLKFELALSGGSQRGDYAKFSAYKGRPITIEFNTTSSIVSAAGAFDAIIAKINKILKREEVVDMTLTGSFSTPDYTFTFTAGDEYIRISSIILEQYNTTTSQFETLATAVVSTQGKEGFGTYDFMIRVMSMQTNEKLNLTAINQDEQIMKGKKYNQYTINYTKPYPVPVGLVANSIQSASGQLVLFVLNDTAVITAFEAALTAGLPGKVTVV